MRSTGSQGNTASRRVAVRVVVNSKASFMGLGLGLRARGGRGEGEAIGEGGSAGDSHHT